MTPAPGPEPSSPRDADAPAAEQMAAEPAATEQAVQPAAEQFVAAEPVESHASAFEPAAAVATIVTVCPDGPLIVRGDFAVVDATGQPVPGARRTTALCRCGKSRAKPFCDGSHKAARFRAP